MAEASWRSGQCGERQGRRRWERWSGCTIFVINSQQLPHIYLFALGFPTCAAAMDPAMEASWFLLGWPLPAK